MKITIKKLHEKTLPEYKKNYVKIDFVSYYLWRPICDIMTILLLDTNVTATCVTVISFIACFISLGCFIIFPGLKGALLGYLFFWIWNISDGIDGNIARYTDSCSKKGDLWDALAGYVAMYVFYFGAGLIAFYENSLINLNFINREMFIIMGSIAGVCTMLPRLVTQKKESIYGKESSLEMKDRSSYNLFKIIALNLISINGFAGLLLLIAILFHFVNIYMTIYFFIMIAFGGFSLFIIMRDLR
mgnify:CR=1 FL=1